MYKKLINKNLFPFIITFFLLYVILLFVINPEKYINSVYNGFLLFAVNVLPALFPFFFLTKLLTSFNSVYYFSNLLKKPVNKLFKMPKQFSYIFFMSILSGYPIGAKLASETRCDKDTMTRLSAVCSTSGPVFIIGTVGFSMLGNKNIGFIIYLSHILAVIFFAFISGLFVKEYNDYDYNPSILNDNTLSDSIYNSVISILKVGGFIAVFYMFIDMLGSMTLYGFIENIFIRLFNGIGISQDLSKGFLSGFIEVTRSCNEISNCVAPLSLKLCFTAFFITFGGSCVIMQCFAFLKNKIFKAKYVFYKIIQSFLAFSICGLLCLVFNI